MLQTQAKKFAWVFVWFRGMGELCLVEGARTFVKATAGGVCL